MNVKTVLTTLQNNPYGQFPRVALEAAINQQEEITPHLLACLEKAAHTPDQVTDTDCNMVFFALYLLAQFREERAYPLIIKLVSHDEETVDFLVGDVVTEGLHRILASVCGGDIGPIKHLVECYNVGEFIRSAALTSLLTLYNEGSLSQEEIESYLKVMFRSHPVRQPSYVWDSLCRLSSTLRLTELLPDIRLAFTDGLVDSTVESLAGYEKEIQQEVDPVALERLGGRYITDTIKDLQGWACFQPEPVRKSLSFPGSIMTATGSVVRDTPKVGRNDPCPCNSGKKYKKCCGR